MRKLIASCFIDQNFEIVWRESISQAVDMGQYWGSRQSVETVAHDTRTLSLNVMSRAGFGKSFPFNGHHEAQIALNGTSLSYKDALQTILENSIVIMVVGTRFLAKPWLPRYFRDLHYACISFQGYMTELFEAGKMNSSQAVASDRNLMDSLVRASHEGTSGSLNEREIYGNSKIPSQRLIECCCQQSVKSLFANVRVHSVRVQLCRARYHGSYLCMGDILPRWQPSSPGLGVRRDHTCPGWPPGVRLEL